MLVERNPGLRTTATCAPPSCQSRFVSHRADSKRTQTRTASRFLPAGRSESKVRAFRNARACRLRPTGGLSVQLRGSGARRKRHHLLSTMRTIGRETRSRHRRRRLADQGVARSSGQPGHRRPKGRQWISQPQKGPRAIRSTRSMTMFVESSAGRSATAGAPAALKYSTPPRSVLHGGRRRQRGCCRPITHGDLCE